MLDRSIFCFPSWTKKAVSFTIDDGNLRLDKRFIDTVRPGGITGSFNLCGTSKMGNLTPEEYREFYRGFEVTNHVSHHPKVILPTDEYVLSDETIDFEKSDRTKIYNTGIDGLYYKAFTTWWGCVATTDAYIKCIDQGKKELEEMIAEGNAELRCQFCDVVYNYTAEELKELLDKAK